MSDCMVSVVLFSHVKDKEQSLVYYVSKVIVDAETQYSRMEQTTLALKSAAQKLCPYFQAHQVTVLTNQSLRSVLHKLNISRRMMSGPLS